MIRIGIFNRNLNDPAPSGIKAFLYEVLRRLIHTEGQFHFTLVAFNPGEARELERQFPDGPRTIVQLPWRLKATRYAWLAGMRSLSSAVGPQDLFWAGTPWPFGRLDRPLVVTVNDFFPMMRLHPQIPAWLWWLKARKYWAGVNAACRRAAFIGCISQTTADDLRARWRGPLPPVEVTYLGVDIHDWQGPSLWDEVTLRARLKLPAAGLVFATLSSQEPHKNQLRIIQAFAEVVLPAHPDATLVLAGGAGSATPALREYIVTHNLNSRIHLPGVLTQPELHALLKFTTAFVFPSLAEGFGIPVLEAMAAGTPVITSNFSSMPEVAGSAALLVDPCRTDEIGRAMLALAADAEQRRHFAALGRHRAAQFSWDATAERYAAVFQRVARMQPNPGGFKAG